MEIKMIDKDSKVLITTAHRGVFYGTLQDTMDNGKTVELSNARCAIYFGTTGGFLELADTGPTATSRIGSMVSEIILYDVTSVTNVSPAAAERWENWKK